MRIITALLFISFIASGAGHYQLIKKIDIPGNYLTTDPLGYCYVESKNRIYKYDKDGNPINKYSNNNYAEIASIDATNPYKVLTFYQSFGKIIFLDNMLSDNGSPIDLMRSNFNQASLVCHSFDNGFWLYEPLLNELFKLNNSMEVTQQSGNLTRLLRQQVKPNFLIEFNSRVYLNNPEHGILVFDQYGTYLKTLPLKGLKSFQVKDDRVYYVKDQQLLTYYFKTLDMDTTLLPVTDNILQVQIEKKRLYILTGAALHIYQIN